MAQDKQLTDVDTIAFQGGMDTYHEPGLLAPGSFSMVQNMRQMHPGLKQRAGYIKKHSTADSTNGVLSMFQFSKGKRTERHFYAQMSDGDVLEATDAPPAVTTGAFGTEVFDGTSSGQVPASWSVLNDLLIYSNGVDQHQIYPGTISDINAFYVYNSDTKLPEISDTGSNYTSEVTDSSATSVAVLDSLGNQGVAMTGTVTASGTTITGSGTAFLSELTVGQMINLDVQTLIYYPVAQNGTYVKATSYRDTNTYPYFATDPTKTLTGVVTGNAWQSANLAITEQRFHIDIGSANVINKIYYENGHISGGSTDTGAKTFTFWGSNSGTAFAETTYGTDTGWTQLTCSQSTFDEHVAADQADPKYITVTNTTPYRYYAVKIADNYGNATGIVLRRIVMQVSDESDEQKLIDTISSNTSATVTSAFTGHFVTSVPTTTNDCI